jgi:hypothetical protein
MQETERRLCRLCGSPFVVSKKSRALYCSERCRRSFQNEQRKIERGEEARARLGRGVCPVCGKEFRRKREGHFYCSKSCCNKGEWLGLEPVSSPIADPFDPEFIASLDWWEAAEVYANACLDPLPVGAGE